MFLLVLVYSVTDAHLLLYGLVAATDVVLIVFVDRERLLINLSYLIDAHHHYLLPATWTPLPRLIDLLFCKYEAIVADYMYQWQ